MVTTRITAEIAIQKEFIALKLFVRPVKHGSELSDKLFCISTDIARFAMARPKANTKSQLGSIETSFLSQKKPHIR
jgi:hypothetical protein